MPPRGVTPREYGIPHTEAHPDLPRRQVGIFLYLRGISGFTKRRGYAIMEPKAPPIQRFFFSQYVKLEFFFAFPFGEGGPR